MVKNKNTSFSTHLASMVVHGMQEKKANDIVRLDLRPIHAAVTDYFVICHADSPAQISAIAKSVEDEVYKQLKQVPWRKEGLSEGEWILLDFVDVVVHIFKTEKRKLYEIEELWGDAESELYQSA